MIFKTTLKHPCTYISALFWIISLGYILELELLGQKLCTFLRVLIHAAKLNFTEAVLLSSSNMCQL